MTHDPVEEHPASGERGDAPQAPAPSVLSHRPGSLVLVWSCSSKLPEGTRFEALRGLIHRRRA